MHIAFDGGCFQQGILGGIYQVGCNFLNTAKLLRPDLKVTLLCDSRQGTIREAALAGLTWRPDVIYGDVAASYDPPEQWPAVRDPHLRFFVDGRIVEAELEDGRARYTGPTPTHAFAVLSRAGISSDAPSTELPRGVRIHRISIHSTSQPARRVQVKGSDRRLTTGFLDDAGACRWTDGAGFVPLAFFAEMGGTIQVTVDYAGLDEYRMRPGGGAEAVMAARRDIRRAERAKLLDTISKQLRADGCMAYVTNHFTPVIMPDMINVAVAYDLIPVLFPQYFYSDALTNFNENMRVFASAHRVYAISDCTREDLIEHKTVTAERAMTFGIAASRGFHPRPHKDVEHVLAKFGLRRHEYVMMVATIEPRKNHLRLLHAYIALRRRQPHCPDLVFVGQLGWNYQQVLALRADAGLEPSVKTLSDVPEDDLACLYSGAMFSVYPSVYEGFGLPIVEAMACGCPVLTSDRSSMREVAGSAAELVNPYDIDALADALQRMTKDQALRKDLARRGLERARFYDWERSSAIVLQDLVRLCDAA